MEAPQNQGWLHAKVQLKKYFLTGLMVIVPTVVTLWVLFTVLAFIDGFFAGLPEAYRPRTYIPIPGISVLFTVALILAIGFSTRHYLGRKLVEYSDRLMGSIPIFRGIYKALKQAIETVITSQGQHFRQVVLIEYPRRGIYTLAFVTSTVRGEIKRHSGEGSMYVFVPTTPNPTSGFLLMIPKEDVTPLNIKVDEAFKIIMSGGIVNPEDLPPEGPPELPSSASRAPE